MAQKTTYMYKVLIGKNGNNVKTEYCYARNALKAIEGFKELYKEEKNDSYKAVVFGYANEKYHAGVFERFTEDEVALIKKNNFAAAEAYSNRRVNKVEVPDNATFVSAKDMEKGLLA